MRNAGIVSALVAACFLVAAPSQVSAQTDEDRDRCFSTGTEDYKNKSFYDVGYAACDKFIKSQRYKGADLAYYVRQRADWLRRKGEFEASLRDFAWAIELDPTHVESYDFRGDVYFERGDYQRSIDDYNAAIRIDPGYAPAYFARGRAQEKLGRIEEAKQSYRLSLAQKSRNRIGDWAHGESRIRLDELEKR